MSGKAVLAVVLKAMRFQSYLLCTSWHEEHSNLLSTSSTDEIVPPFREATAVGSYNAPSVMAKELS